MTLCRAVIIVLIALIAQSHRVAALERTNATFKVFQFPDNLIPAVDGKDEARHRA